MDNSVVVLSGEIANVQGNDVNYVNGEYYLKDTALEDWMIGWLEYTNLVYYYMVRENEGLTSANVRLFFAYDNPSDWSYGLSRAKPSISEEGEYWIYNMWLANVDDKRIFNLLRESRNRILRDNRPWFFDLRDIDDYILFVMNEESPSRQIFTTERIVKNFRFYRVEMNYMRWSYGGYIVESEPLYNFIEVLYVLDKLTPYTPLVIQGTLFIGGATANFGFTFVDEYGDTRYFVILDGMASFEAPIFAREVTYYM